MYFEVIKKRGTRCDRPESVESPRQYPCFTLVFNYNWNDYSKYTWFGLHYFPEEGKGAKFIGELKLMCKDNENTFDTLPACFDEGLDSKRYCSLGINVSYYQKIHDILRPQNLDNELLTALCDCAYNIEIYERFKSDIILKESLFRDLYSEKAYQDARFILSGTSPQDAYSFCYRYSPEFNNTVYTNWKVTLQYKSPIFLRTIGVIGENGVGKTQMLSQLVNDFLTESTPNFDHEPLFNSVIVICSTPLDQFAQLLKKRKRRKPFAYNCLLQKERKTAKKLVNDIKKISKSGKYMYKKSLMQYYVEMVKEYLGNVARDIFVVIDEEKKDYKFNELKVKELTHILSSGQLSILQLITSICSNIHMSSLLIIDEPEVHLHPSFILEFMTKLGNILKQFDSFAIIATHSPLIVREIVDSQVFLMQRMEGDIPQIAKVNFETFGEDATKLYRNIFGYDEHKSFFTLLVRKMLETKSYIQVIELLDKYMELGMNARLAIRDIKEELKEQH